MKTITLTVVLVLLAGTAEAQSKVPLPDPKCGQLTRNNSGSQYGNGESPWLEYVVETLRSPETDCLAQVRVEGKVNGVPGSADTKSGVFAASLRKPVLLPAWGTYYVAANHFFRYVVEFYYGTTTSDPIEVKPKEESEPDPDPILAHEDPTCPECADPIIVDPRRDGFRLTSARDGVFFDVDADGVAEKIAWTAADSDDAFLALDRNGNGRIDDGSELFGNHTPVAPNARETASNGFDALRFTEGSAYGGTSVPYDDVIDVNDAVHARLLLWRDANHNGISEADELTLASNAGLVSIATNYRTSRRRDQFGNEFLLRAKIHWVDGRAHYAYDVWLQIEK